MWIIFKLWCTVIGNVNKFTWVFEWWKSVLYILLILFIHLYGFRSGVGPHICDWPVPHLTCLRPVHRTFFQTLLHISSNPKTSFANFIRFWYTCFDLTWSSSVFHFASIYMCPIRLILAHFSVIWLNKTHMSTSCQTVLRSTQAVILRSFLWPSGTLKTAACPFAWLKSLWCSIMRHTKKKENV